MTSVLASAAQRLGAELRSQDDAILDQIPTEVTKHSKACTVGVSSSDMLAGPDMIEIRDELLGDETRIVDKPPGERHYFDCNRGIYDLDDMDDVSPKVELRALLHGWVGDESSSKGGILG